MNIWTRTPSPANQENSTYHQLEERKQASLRFLQLEVKDLCQQRLKHRQRHHWRRTFLLPEKEARAKRVRSQQTQVDHRSLSGERAKYRYLLEEQVLHEKITQALRYWSIEHRLAFRVCCILIGYTLGMQKYYKELDMLLEREHDLVENQRYEMKARWKQLVPSSAPIPL